MALKDVFKKKDTKKAGMEYAVTNNGATPMYSNFGDSVYASDIVVQSIRCKANEFKKLDPRHVIIKGEETKLVQNDSIARVLKKPNEFMTICDFLDKVTTLLELSKNVFIYVDYYVTQSKEKHFNALYPLKPNYVEYLTNERGELFLNMRFANGSEILLPKSKVVHWRKDFGVDDYFGGRQFGGNDDAGLLTMLQRYDQLTQSIAKAVECSCQVNGIVKTNTYIDDETLNNSSKEFTRKLKNAESGFLWTDQSIELTMLPRDVKLVDSETLKFFYDAILRANGTSLAILNGDYTKEQKEAYYEHALEADIKSLGAALTNTLFSDTELSYGHQIILYPNDINFMTMENKIAALQACLPAGVLLRDEARALLGMAPLPNGLGQVIAQGYDLVFDVNGNEQSDTGKPAKQNNEKGLTENE